MTITAEQVVQDHAPLVGTGALRGMKNISVGIEAVIIEWNGRSVALHPDLADAYLLHLEAASCAEHGDWARRYPAGGGSWTRRSWETNERCDCGNYRDGVLANARDRFLPKPEANTTNTPTTQWPPVRIDYATSPPSVTVGDQRYVPEQKQ